MTKRFFPAYLLLAAACCTFFTSCHRNRKNTNPPGSNDSVLVSTQQVGSSNIPGILSLSGNTEANRTVRLAFPIPGKINAIPVNDGQFVRSGGLLATLDMTDYNIFKNTADIAVNEARDQYNRAKIMFDRGSLSESDYKKVQFALDEALNQQELQRKIIADTRLYAPFDGVVLEKLAGEGEIVAMAIPVVVFADLSRIKVAVSVPETELEQITTGNTATVTIAAADTMTYRGKINLIGSYADPLARDFTAEVELDNPGMRIRPGMVAEVQVNTERETNAITLPLGTLLKDLDGSNYVYIVDLQKRRAFRRDVATGAITGNSIVISSGLREGETVVTGGNHKLYDGAPVVVGY